MPNETMLDLLQEYWLIIIVLLMVVSAIALSRLLAGRARLPYVRRDRLVTETELRFYRQLARAIEDQWQIFAMVRVADLIQVEKGANGYRAWLNKILSKHIDFVLCDASNLKVLLAIELDDPTHEQADRVARDRFVDSALADAGLPLLRVPTSKNYDPKALRQMIDRKMAK